MPPVFFRAGAKSFCHMQYLLAFGRDKLYISQLTDALTNENPARPRSDEQGDEAAMLGVLFGQGEVLVLILMTAIVVFLVARTRKRR
jgi:hypothetical protein